ncbi:MAG: sigma 54-interacting transcriptional regulator, partial [Bacteroidota bacterium]
YIRKPFTFQDIYPIIDEIIEKFNIQKDINGLHRHQKDEITFDHIIHQSAIMKQLIQVSKKIAQTDATTILLLGDSGTGKDLFARAIHNESKRKGNPFVTINCSSLPDTLLESELFGHEKGAFTDAKNLKKGLFEIADGGTVFLDEIGELSPATQVKLLGVLENRVIMHLGGTKEISVDVRIIAATNQNLTESIKNKSFRGDLYYRLQVFQIDIPRLCQRKEDIPLLVDYFISYFNDIFNKNINSIHPEVKKLLDHCYWPGNVRELRNVIERAVILETGNELQASSLPGELNRQARVSPTHSGYLIEFPEEGISLEELEKQVIQQALEMAGFNQTKASQLLDISRDTLRYKKKKHKL